MASQYQGFGGLANRTMIIMKIARTCIEIMAELMTWTVLRRIPISVKVSWLIRLEFTGPVFTFRVMSIRSAPRKHAYIILTPLNPTFI